MQRNREIRARARAAACAEIARMRRDEMTLTEMEMERGPARSTDPSGHTQGDEHATETDDSTGESNLAMSFRAMLYVQQLRNISLIERAILAKMADHASPDGGSVYVSLRTIADHAQMTPRSVRRIVNKLLDDGRIEVTGDNGRKGGRRPTTYKVVIPNSFDIKAVSTAGRTPESSLKAPRADTRVRPGRTPESSEPVFLTKESKYQSLRSWRPVGRSDPLQVRKIIWGEGVELVQELTGRTARKARGLIGELLKAVGKQHPERLLEALEQAADSRPTEAAAYLTKACSGYVDDETRLDRIAILSTIPIEDRWRMTQAEIEAYIDREVARQRDAEGGPIIDHDPTDGRHGETAGRLRGKVMH